MALTGLGLDYTSGVSRRVNYCRPIVWSAWSSPGVASYHSDRWITAPVAATAAALCKWM